MTVTERNKVRRKRAALAWKSEVLRLYQGKGTMDWTAEQQLEMIKLNHLVGYVVQWLQNYSDEVEIENPNVQFLDFSYDYPDAHSGPHRNKQFGYYNWDKNAVEYISSVTEITLSDPQYKGGKNPYILKQQREQRYKVFGLYNFTNQRNRIDKAKFGLD